MSNHAIVRRLALLVSGILLVGTLGATPAFATEATPTPTPVVETPAPEETPAPTPAPTATAEVPSAPAPSATPDPIAAAKSDVQVVTYSGFVTRVSSQSHGDTAGADSPVQLFHVVDRGFINLDFSAVAQILDQKGSIRVRIAVPASVDLGSTEASKFDAISAFSLAGGSLPVTELVANPNTKALVTTTPATAAVHKIFAVLVTPSNVPGSSPGSGQSSGGVFDAVNHADAYWNQQSSGKIDFSLSATLPWYKSAYSCTTIPGAQNIWAEAADKAAAKGYTPALNTHLVLFFPADADCAGPIGLGSVGQNINAGGLVWSIGTSSAIGKSTLSHELGHNLSFGHASWADCDSAQPQLGTDFSGCINRNYGDIQDVMGYGMDDLTGGAISSPHAIRANLWGAGSWVNAPKGPSTHILKSVSGNTGLRSVVVTDDLGIDYFVEFRDFTGEDAQYATAGCSYSPYWCVGTEPSVRVLRLETQGTRGDDSYLIGRTEGGVRKVNYTAGQAFIGSDMTITVNSISAGTASVTVTRGQFTHGTVSIGLAGSALQANTAGWSTGTGFAYAWYRNDVFIPGATGKTYTPVAADGKNALIKVRVTGTKAGYPSYSTGSAARNVSLSASGTPTVTRSGPSRVGSLLGVTAVSYTYDGGTPLASPVRSYQWLRNGTAITGATASSYRPVGADVGARLSVRVTVKHPGYAPSVIVSTQTSAIIKGIISGTQSAATVAKNISGTWLTAAPASGAITESGVTYSYQWFRSNVAVAGATKNTYELKDADRARSFYVRITVTKPNYTSAVLLSPARNYTLTPSAAQKVLGTVRVGATLSLSSVTFSTYVGPVPSPARTYQWYRNGVAISGATAATYTLVAADLGTQVSVRTTAVAPGYQSYNVLIFADAKVAAGVIAGSTTAPSVSTNATTLVLTANVPAGSVASASGVTTKYQWYRSGVAVSGATTKNYTLTTADYNRSLFVRVTVTKAAHTTVVLNSVAINHSVVPSTTSPRIVGPIAVGKLVGADEARTYTKGATPTYQWLRNGAAIPSATSRLYTITAADKGKALSVRVTARVSGFLPSITTSPATQLIGDNAMAGGSSVGPVTVMKAATSPRLIATTTTSVTEPGVTKKYQWYRNGVAIAGATATNYTGVDADFGALISVRITHTKSGYTPVVAVSAGRSLSPTITGTPKITPTLPKRGAVATFTPPTITIPDGAAKTVEYQWFRDGQRIVGATKLTYTPVTADKGKKLTARIVVRSAGWLTAVRVSPATAPLG